ncbi:MAG: U32 family peptidase [Spirochaetia bacterium]|nr:U32 family peptidase [Spirochaetia bacterium]
MPKSFLKDLKRKLSQNLSLSYEDFITSRTERVLSDFKTAGPSASVLASPERLAVKFDRLDFLEGIKHYLFNQPTLRLHEIIFEPKRMFLGESNAESVIQPIAAFAKENGLSLRLAIPTVLRSWEEPDLRKWLRAFSKAGENRYEVGNLGALEILRSEGIKGDLSSDFTLYALNSEASTHWSESGIRRVALSVEDDLENISSHLSRFPWPGARPEVILYKDTPLFIAEACSLTALHNGCPGSKVCGYRSLEIENDEGEQFIVAHEKCKSVVYGKEAFSLSQHRSSLASLGVRDFRVDFLTRPYTREEILGILVSVDQGEKIPGTHSSNFERRLL